MSRAPATSVIGFMLPLLLWRAAGRPHDVSRARDVSRKDDRSVVYLDGASEARPPRSLLFLVDRDECALDGRPGQLAQEIRALSFLDEHAFTVINLDLEYLRWLGIRNEGAAVNRAPGLSRLANTMISTRKT